MKRLHDQYMRASSVGIDAIIASLSEIIFLSGPSKVIIRGGTRGLAGVVPPPPNAGEFVLIPL